jgi:hypothetical protein
VPTQFIVPIADGNSVATIGALSVPKYLSLDAEGASQANVAGIGNRVVLRFLAAQGENAQSVRTIVGVPFAVAITGNGEVTWLLDLPDRTAAAVAFAAQGDNAVVVPALRLGLPPVQAIGAGAVTADFAPFLPSIREPEWNEMRGTINLVRNASVENTSVGLLDWAGVNGATIAADSAVSWHGLRSVQVTYPNAGSDARVTVRSQRGLGITGQLNTAMVGSFSALGSLTQVQARLVATYTDATTDTATGDLFDLAAVTDWARIATPSVPLNAAKTLDYLTLDLTHPVAGSTTVLNIDGAQIEQDRGEGATPFAWGDMGASYAWLGPAGLSMSLRETMAVTT